MKRLQLSLISALGALLVLALLAHTYAAINKMLVDDVAARMREYSENESTFVKYMLDQEMQSLRSGARFISENPSYTREQIVGILTELQKTTHFYRVLVARPDGTSITDSNDVSNVAARDYFPTAMAGRETISRYMTFLDGNNNGIALAVPLYRGGKIIGILVGAHTRQSFDSTFSARMFGGEAYCVIVDKKGQIIMFTPTKYKITESNNIFDFYSQVKFTRGETPENLLSRFAAGLDGLFRFSHKGQQRLVYYKPLGIHDWMVLSAVSPDTAFKLNRYIYLLVTSQIILLAGIFTVLLAYYLVSFRKKNRLLAALAQGREIINHAIPGGVIKTELTEGFPILYKSRGFYELTGFSEEEIRTQFANRFTNFIHPEDIEQTLDGFEQQITGGSYVLQYRFATQKGYIWVYDSGRVISDIDEKKVLVSVLIDMTRVKISIDALQNSAEHDSATDLYNKAATRKYIETTLMGGRREEDLHALVLMDIDNFKHINDTYGHQTGDQVIISFAQVLKQMFRKTDVVGRVGGDEFMILITHVPNFAFVEDFLVRIGNNIRSVKLPDGTALSCSLGAAFFPMHGETFETLYKNADKALYEAKRRGKDRCEIFRP